MKLILHTFCAFCVGAAFDAHAATAYEACSDMTNKLAVIYDLHGFPRAFDSQPRYKTNPIKTAENVVSGAYGETRNSLDKKWPGFFDWSAIAVLKALRASESPEAFRADAMLKCVERYE